MLKAPVVQQVNRRSVAALPVATVPIRPINRTLSTPKVVVPMTSSIVTKPIASSLIHPVPVRSNTLIEIAPATLPYSRI